MVRKGFTLIELLVVLGILAVLMVVLIPVMSGQREKAEIAKCLELVKNVQESLTHLYTSNSGAWPQVLYNNSNKSAGLDASAGYVLSTAGMSLSANSSTQRLTGNDRFGIITPWAAEVVKKSGTGCSESTAVPSIGGNIADHRLRYAICDPENENKIFGVNVPGTVASAKNEKTVDVRATAAVWCIGPKGQVVKSWSDGDTQGVK
ncbi:MAG: type II secretion system GspH family protein [Kiritimatiellae bacterium]|nr:type II secretion system GspH family protein [Kiritimatiellia bacterium]